VRRTSACSAAPLHVARAPARSHRTRGRCAPPEGACEPAPVGHGLPVLAYATGAIGDWIEHGVNDMLIDLGQSEQFFQALRWLLTERHILSQLRYNAWARAANLAFHSWEQTYRDFLRALKK